MRRRRPNLRLLVDLAESLAISHNCALRWDSSEVRLGDDDIEDHIDRTGCWRCLAIRALGYDPEEKKR